MHTLTATGKYELRIDMVDNSYNTRYAVYKRFSIGGAPSKYRLTVDDYSGNAGRTVYTSLLYITLNSIPSINK